MTDRKLLEQALEALEYAVPFDGSAKTVTNAITALRERLAQPQRTHWEGCDEVHPECRKPEPVVWMNPSWADPDTRGWPNDSFESIPIDGWIPLSPRREWVGLTEEEIKALPKWYPSHETVAVLPLIRAVETKLREKNNG